MAATEFLSPGYKAHRGERKSDGSGVFIVLTNELFSASIRVCELETLWVNLKCAQSKDLLIGAYYQPNESDALSYVNFDTSVTRACGQGNSRFIEARYFNYPDCNL